MSEPPTSEPRPGAPAPRAGAATPRPRRPLPPIRVHRTLPPGAVARPTEAPGTAQAAPPTGEPRTGSPQVGTPVTGSPQAGTPVTGASQAGPFNADVPAGVGVHMGAPRGGARPRRVWIPVAAGVAVLAVVAGLVLATGGDDAAPAQSPPPRDRTVAADPPVLRLGQGPESPTAGRTTADAPANLRLATAPPTGPARGPVRAYPLDEAAPSADVARLAAALGVPGRPLREGAGWTVRGATATLRVEDVSGWPWLLAPDDQPPPLLDSTAARRPGDLAARDAAEGVLRRVDAGGYGPARPVAGEAGYADVIASPLVATLPTAGLETWLRFDDRLRLAAASGWLGRPETAATYPLLQARAALEASHGTAQCPPTCGEAVSAVAGLALRRHADGRALLVPAWLFETRGSAVPLTALAIPPAYLDAPEPQPTATGSMPIPLPTR